MYKLDDFALNAIRNINTFSLISGADAFLCPVGEMTEFVINNNLFLCINIKGCIDNNINKRIGNNETYHYRDLKILKPKVIIVLHEVYSQTIVEKIKENLLESCIIINVFDVIKKYLTDVYFKTKSYNDYEGARILICRPRGGLNDTLSQIAKCWIYAIKYNRKLYVDTNRSGFLDCFSNYFNDPGLIEFGIPVWIDSVSDVFPASLSGRISSYSTNRVIRNNKGSLYPTVVYCDSVYGEDVTFDFNFDYKNQILIHEQEGNYKYSCSVFESFELKDEVLNYILDCIIPLGEYSSVHIRNTDYKMEYKDFLSEVVMLEYNKVVLCTDDYECQMYSKNNFGDKMVIISDIPNSNGETLHNNNNLERYTLNVETLKDLLILSCSKKIYSKPVSGLRSIYGMGDIDFGEMIVESGFCLLAKELNNNGYFSKIKDKFRRGK